MNDQIKRRQDYEQHCRDMRDDTSEAWLQYNACIARLPPRANFLYVTRDDWQAIRAAEEECAHWNVLREEIARTRKAVEGQTKFSMGPLKGEPLACAVAFLASIDAQLAEINAGFLPAYERLVKSRGVLHGNSPPNDPAPLPQVAPVNAMTNIEMSDLLMGSYETKVAAIERDGCCGGEPMSGGQCFGVGVCPRVVETERCTRFVNNYMKWIDEANQPKFEEVPAFAE